MIFISKTQQYFVIKLRLTVIYLQEADTMVDILDRIIYFRNIKGWSEYQLAEQSGIAQSTINSWYRKHLLPTVPSLDKICQAFGITLSQFFAETDEIPMLTNAQKQLVSASCHLNEQQIQQLILFIETL